MRMEVEGKSTYIHTQILISLLLPPLLSAMNDFKNANESQ